jgi:uncharacterized protein YqeY
MLAAIKQIEVDKRIELDDPAVVDVLNRMIKQRRDSVSQFRQGGRDDLAAVELGEIEVIEMWLPEQLSDDEVESLIERAIAITGAESIRDMGKVMGMVKSEAEGRADMGAVGKRVKARLGQD